MRFQRAVSAYLPIKCCATGAPATPPRSRRALVVSGLREGRSLFRSAGTLFGAPCRSVSLTIAHTHHRVAVPANGWEADASSDRRMLHGVVEHVGDLLEPHDIAHHDCRGCRHRVPEFNTALLCTRPKRVRRVGNNGAEIDLAFLQWQLATPSAFGIEQVVDQSPE